MRVAIQNAVMLRQFCYSLSYPSVGLFRKAHLPVVAISRTSAPMAIFAPNIAIPRSLGNATQQIRSQSFQLQKCVIMTN